MKKNILGAILLFSIISCSEDSMKHDEVASQETSMNINLSAPKTNLTGKDVKRGILPVTVKTVAIKVQPWNPNFALGAGGPDLTRLASTFDFKIVPDANVDASDGFEIRNFSTGISQFNVTASSSTASSNMMGEVSDYGSWTGESSTLSVNDLFIKWEAKSVAINYRANPQIINVIAGINTPVSFTLLPLNGRVISVFQLSDELKNWNYTAKVQTNYDMYNTGLIAVDKTHNGVTYIDGTRAYQGVSVKHIIAIFDDKGEKVAEYPIAIGITNGESTNTIYTILSDQIPASNKLQTTILVPDFKSPPPSEKGV